MVDFLNPKKRTDKVVDTVRNLSRNFHRCRNHWGA